MGGGDEDGDGDGGVNGFVRILQAKLDPSKISQTTTKTTTEKMDREMCPSKTDPIYQHIHTTPPPHHINASTADTKKKTDKHPI